MKNLKLLGFLVFGVLIGVIGAYLVYQLKQPPIDVTNSQKDQHKEQTYTCSMHPQIRQNEPGECPICGMNLIPLDEASSSDNPLAFEMTPEAVKLSNIQTIVVGAVNNNDTENKNKQSNLLSLNGILEADERQTSSLVAHLPGRIEKLYIGFTGEYISKGMRIAKIYAPELITAQRELIEAKKIEELSPGLLNAAKNKLKYWKLPEETINRILEEKVIREYFDLYADASGVINSKQVKVGDHVKEGSVLFEVQNLSSLWVTFDVYESEISKIKIGDKVSFKSAAIPNREFYTTITFIDPVIDRQTRIARVRGKVNNMSGKLKPEMFVVGNLKSSIKNTATSKKDQPIIIPKSAVLWTGSRSVVYVKLPDIDVPSYEYREITISENLGENYLIANGLERGEAVVVNGAFVIDASAQLNNQKSMMNRNVKISDVETTKQLPDYTLDAPSLFKAQLVNVATEYIKLKDALVASDYTAVNRLIIAFHKSVSKVDMALLKGEEHIYWMKLLKALNAHGKGIADAKNIDEQRKQFDYLSQVLIETLKVFGVNGNSFYVQHCPMADNDNGADWISMETNILNPYFGDKMLKCGFIKDTIDINYKNY